MHFFVDSALLQFVLTVLFVLCVGTVVCMLVYAIVGLGCDMAHFKNENKRGAPPGFMRRLLDTYLPVCIQPGTWQPHAWTPLSERIVFRLLIWLYVCTVVVFEDFIVDMGIPFVQRIAVPAAKQFACFVVWWTLAVLYADSWQERAEGICVTFANELCPRQVCPPSVCATPDDGAAADAAYALGAAVAFDMYAPVASARNLTWFVLARVQAALADMVA
jgi:hypothetical protein